MLMHKKIKVGKKYVKAFLINLQSRNFILLRGSRGYVMCGYLDLKTAEKLRDAAIKIVGVATVKQALETTVHSCTSTARKLGVSKGQPIKEALKIIA